MNKEQRQKTHAQATLRNLKTRRTKKKSRVKHIVRTQQGPTVTKARMLLAIDGSMGVVSMIAQRLGVSTGWVNVLLRREGWEDIAVIFNEELDRVGDIAEQTVYDVMMQRLDYGQALKAATWFLSKKHKGRGYNDSTTTIIEGGVNPVQMEKKTSIDDLDLPLEAKVILLEALKKKRTAEEEYAQAEEKEAD